MTGDTGDAETAQLAGLRAVLGGTRGIVRAICSPAAGWITGRLVFSDGGCSLL